MWRRIIAASAAAPQPSTFSAARRLASSERTPPAKKWRTPRQKGAQFHRPTGLPLVVLVDVGIFHRLYHVHRAALGISTVGANGLRNGEVSQDGITRLSDDEDLRSVAISMTEAQLKHYAHLKPSMSNIPRSPGSKAAKRNPATDFQQLGLPPEVAPQLAEKPISAAIKFCNTVIRYSVQSSERNTAYQALEQLKNMKARDARTYRVLCDVTNIICDLQYPRRLVVCLEQGNPRREISAEYKSKRTRDPRSAAFIDYVVAYTQQRAGVLPGLALKLPDARPRADGPYAPLVRGASLSVLPTLGATFLQAEADDVIATVVAAADSKRPPVIVVSADMDMVALLRPGVAIYNVVQKQFWTEGTFKGRFGTDMTPAMLADYKALFGDKSDSIPGVRGLNQEAGTKLLLQFGSAQSLLSACHVAAEVVEQHAMPKSKLKAALKSQKNSEVQAALLLMLREKVAADLSEEMASLLLKYGPKILRHADGVAKALSLVPLVNIKSMISNDSFNRLLNGQYPSGDESKSAKLPVTDPYSKPGDCVA